jgi:hypothetical protein
LSTSVLHLKDHTVKIAKENIKVHVTFWQRAHSKSSSFLTKTIWPMILRLVAWDVLSMVIFCVKKLTIDYDFYDYLTLVFLT